MSIARYAVAQGSLAQGETPVIRSKTPPKRHYVALADVKVIPEPR